MEPCIGALVDYNYGNPAIVIGQLANGWTLWLRDPIAILGGEVRTIDVYPGSDFNGDINVLAVPAQHA